jgi:biotin synthase-like enzyme
LKNLVWPCSVSHWRGESYGKHQLFSERYWRYQNDFSTISVEVQPLSQEEYERLHEAGVHSVLVYQETYHQEVYKNTIPKERNLILIID